MDAMHLHAGALDLAVFAAMLLIVGFVIRMVETKWPDSPAAKALAFIY